MLLVGQLIEKTVPYRDADDPLVVWRVVDKSLYFVTRVLYRFWS